MWDVINDLIHLNLSECRQVMEELKKRIKLLEERERLVKELQRK